MIKRISIIGCGSIGTEILLSLKRGDIPNAAVFSVFDIKVEAVKQILKEMGDENIEIFTDFEALLNSSTFALTDIVIEAASKMAVKEYGKKILESGKKFVTLSSGAFQDNCLLSELLQVAEKKKGSLIIPTGAIAGLDAIRSVRRNLSELSITTTKNPSALRGAPFFKDSQIKLELIREKTVLFEGSAAEAISKFPANVNVAVTLALAGLGLHKTRVRIVVDPEIIVNQHEIFASGGFGEISITTRNNPMITNPKTSALAAFSAIESIRGLCFDSFRVGS